MTDYEASIFAEQPNHPPPLLRTHRQHVDDVCRVDASLVPLRHPCAAVGMDLARLASTSQLDVSRMLQKENAYPR